jgi:hypothetical protein
MNIFIATFIIMLIAVIGMAVGVLSGRRGIQGSCGGLNNIEGLEGSCSVCSEPCEKRKRAVADSHARKTLL